MGHPVGVGGAGDLPQRGRGPPGRDQDGAVRAAGVLGRPPEPQHAAGAGDHRGESAAPVREVAAQGQVSRQMSFDEQTINSTSLM